MMQTGVYQKKATGDYYLVTAIARKADLPEKEIIVYTALKPIPGSAPLTYRLREEFEGMFNYIGDAVPAGA